MKDGKVDVSFFIDALRILGVLVSVHLNVDGFEIELDGLMRIESIDGSGITFRASNSSTCECASITVGIEHVDSIHLDSDSHGVEFVLRHPVEKNPQI